MGTRDALRPAKLHGKERGTTAAASGSTYRSHLASAWDQAEMVSLAESGKPPVVQTDESLTFYRALRRIVRQDDGAAGGEHAADAVADRDPGVGDLGGGGAAHLAYALLQCVHAVHAGMHIRKTAAIGVERQF